MVRGGGKDHIPFHDDIEVGDCEVSGREARGGGVYAHS